MRFLVATTLLVAGMGCGFEHGQLDSDQGGRGDVDGGVGPGSGTGTGTPNPTNPTPAPRTCAYTVTSDTRLCLEFNDGVLTPNALDASAAQLDAKTIGVHMTSRSTASGADPAVTVDAGGSMSILENASLDIGSAITLEAWVRTAGPQSATIIGNQGQYVLGMDGSGFVYCSMAGTSVSANSVYNAYLANGSWHHIACTFDGTDVQAYLDGSTADCSRGNSSISKSGSSGTKIAPNFTGDIDGVRIWAKDIGADLCTHAGRTQCQRQCNDGSEGGSIGFGGH